MRVKPNASQYAIMFFQSLINEIFFTSGIGLDILVNVLDDCIVFLIWAAWILIFILSKKKDFQSGSLLKMPPLSPSKKEFGLDIPK